MNLDSTSPNAEDKTPEQIALNYLMLKLDLENERGEARPVMIDMHVKLGDQLFEMDPDKFWIHVGKARDTLRMLGVQMDD